MLETLPNQWTRKSAAATPVLEGHSFCPPGESSGMERTRFFPRQLVTPDDLTQDQRYFRDKHLRHNRLLHGWGVVCGVRVMKHPTEKCRVIVESGYVLGPYGHEIMVDRDIEIDLCHEGPDGNAVSPCGGGDPWCSDVRVSRPGGRPLYLAIRYDECETRPVRAQGHGCGCGESECEYSRVRDSFVVKVLTDLPTTYSDPMPRPNVLSAFRCVPGESGRKVNGRECPPCPSEPWVILADVTLSDAGEITDIDCFRHRRYVASFADFYFLCTPTGFGIAPDYIREVGPRGELAPANTLVLVKRADGTPVYFPVAYQAVAGERVRAFLEREGKRSYLDPDTGEEFTLADVYAMAGADPERTIASTIEATALIETVTLRPRALAEVRGQLADVIGTAGTAVLEDRLGGAPSRVETVPAAGVRGVVEGSAVAGKLAIITIGEVASRDRDAFVAEMVTGIPAARREAARAEAAAAWDSAKEAIRISENWRIR